MSDRVVAIVQARLGSSRLPGKVLRRFGQRPALEHQLRRLARSSKIAEVVVATTELAQDEPIVELCGVLAVRVLRGSANDVLARFRDAAQFARADVIVRLTADCPLIDPEVVDRIIERHHRSDYTSNTLVRSFPRGLDAEVFGRAVLETAAREATDKYEREHVTPFLYRYPERFLCTSVVRDGESFGHWRWTLDEPRDAAFFDALFARVGERLDEDFRHGWLIDYLRDHLELATINAAVEQRPTLSDPVASMGRLA